MTENELYHYGVLGIKLGKRKNTPAESYYDEKIKKAQPGLDRVRAKSERWQYRKSRDLAEKTGKRQEAGSVKYLKTRAKQMDSMDIKAGRDYVYSYFSYDIRI